MPVAEHHYYQRDLFQQAERLVGLPDLTEEEANALCNLGTLRDRIEEHKRRASRVARRGARGLFESAGPPVAPVYAPLPPAALGCGDASRVRGHVGRYGVAEEQEIL